MKKLVVFVIVSMMLTASLSADTTWIRRFWDEEYRWEAEGRCVIETSDAGYMVYANWYKPTMYDRVWLLKTDLHGDTMWTCKYGEDPALGVTDAVQETNDGRYVFTAGLYTPSGGHSDAWLCKVGSYGDMVWERTYGEVEPAESGRSVQQTADGGYVISGRKEDSVWLIKTDTQGDTLWTSTHMEGEEWAHYGGYSVQQTLDQGYIVATGYSSVGGDLGLLKTDSLGNKEWSRIYADKGNGWCVEQTTDAGYIVAAEYAVIKTDSAGNIVWTRDLDDCRCARQTTDGGYIVAARESLNFKSKLIKLDAEGNITWERTFEFGIGSARQTADGGYILTGGPDVWLAKTDEEGRVSGTGLEEDVEAQSSWEIISSVGSRITLRYADYPQGFAAFIFDATGRKVDEVHSSQTQGTIIWGEGYQTGVYFIRPISDDDPSSVHKVVLSK